MYYRRVMQKYYIESFGADEYVILFVQNVEV